MTSKTVFSNPILVTSNWFSKAIPTVKSSNVSTQLGVHIEEFTETLTEVLPSLSTVEARLLSHTISYLTDLATRLKDGSTEFDATKINHVKLCDGLVDSIVTSVGTGYVLGYDMVGAVNEVNKSNWSKFDNGNPVFHPNGKIAKGKNYKEPDLKPYVPTST